MIITLVVIAFVSVALIDGFARKKAKKEIRSDESKIELRIAMKKMANVEISTYIEEQKKNRVYIGPLINWLKNWENRKNEAQLAAGDFIDDEIINERFYINILAYPEWGLGWCIKRYKFELIWGIEQVAIFQLNSARQPINLMVNKESGLIKALEKKAKKAAMW